MFGRLRKLIWISSRRLLSGIGLSYWFLLQDGKDVVHFTDTNAGVPADHNLTIYEACLLYGPDFGWYSKPINFNKSFADWFYHLLTPLTDYRVTFVNQTIGRWAGAMMKTCSPT